MASEGSHGSRSTKPSDIGAVNNAKKAASMFAAKTKNAFDKIATTVTKAAHNTFDDVNKAISTKLQEATPEEENVFTSLWEESEAVQFCRFCSTYFDNPILGKHHCRVCAGVFCESCVPYLPCDDFQRRVLLPNSLIPTSESGQVRICIPCRRAEGPSKIMKEGIRVALDNHPLVKQRRQSTSAVDKLGNKIVAKLNEVVGVHDEDEVQGSERLPLERGSYYGENGLPRSVPSGPASSLSPYMPTNMSANTVAVSGYFEIFNKSPNETMAVKLITLAYAPANQTSVLLEKYLFEAAKPSYFAVPPGQAVYTFFDPKSTALLGVLLLYDNESFLKANQVSSSSSAAQIFDTRAPGVTPERLAASARVDGFTKQRIFLINGAGHNVVLKYKGDGIMLPRRGSGINRVGFMNYLQGRRFSTGRLDLDTNIEEGTVRVHDVVSV